VFVVLFVVFVGHVLHGDATEIGLLRGVQAIGGILGGLLLGTLGGHIQAHRLLVGGALACGLLDLMIWNGPAVTLTEGVYLGLFIAAGIPGMAYVTGLTALLQQHVPHSHLGRVFGVFFTFYGAFQALGMLLAGILGNTINIVAVLNGQATLYLVAGGITLFGLPSRSVVGVASWSRFRSDR
jgi:MFS family permease